MNPNVNDKKLSPPLSYKNQPYIRQRLSQILLDLDSTMKKPPMQMKHDVDAVVTRLAQLRDHLIAAQRSRQDISFVQSPALKVVNIALSLVISVGYPGGAIQRQALEEAHSLLQDFLQK